jgi:predicted phage gp36 major capsid-like protein
LRSSEGYSSRLESWLSRAGVSVLRDPYTAKPYVLFYTIKRVGGSVQDFDAFKLLKFVAPPAMDAA